MKGSCRRNVMMTGKKSLFNQIASESGRVGRSGGQIDVPEEVQETKSLHDHPNHRPLHHNHDKDATNKAYAPSQLVLACEKVKCLLRSDNEGDAREEE
jgi:hypothetical protein